MPCYPERAFDCAGTLTEKLVVISVFGAPELSLATLPMTRSRRTECLLSLRTATGFGMATGFEMPPRMADYARTSDQGGTNLYSADAAARPVLSSGSTRAEDDTVMAMAAACAGARGLLVGWIDQSPVTKDSFGAQQVRSALEATTRHHNTFTLSTEIIA